MAHNFVRAALVLGLLSSIGPFAIDMYLPAMPEIGRDLGTSMQVMQGTITAYFLAMGVGQMIYGPWADQVGRKLPLYAGIALFVLGTFWCIFASSGNDLLVGRFIQGLGGAAFGVVPRAIVRDMMTGPEATRMMAAIMLVFSVSPMLAPLAGSVLLVVTGWRGIFAALLLAALLSLLVLRFAQGETLAPENRRPLRLGTMLSGCADLFRDRSFLLLTFVGAFGFGSFFLFLAAAPFVYQQGFGLTTTQFSLAFAVNAMAFIGASQLSGPVSARLGNLRALRWGAFGCALAYGVLLLIAANVGVGLWGCMVGLALANGCLGLIMPSAMVLALDHQGEKAGLASSLGGTLQLVTGGVLLVVLGPLLGNTALPMIAGMAFTAGITLILTLLVRTPQAAEDRAA